MEEMIWEIYKNDSGDEAQLTRLKTGGYYLVVSDRYDNSVSIDLDRKHLKDLFNAIGNELGAF